MNTAVMKLRNAVKSAFDIRRSSSKVYHDADGAATEEKLCFLTFDEDVELDGFSSDYAVCSRAVAGELAKCKDDDAKVAFLADCSIEVNDQGENLQLAIKRPNSAEKLNSKSLHF